MIFFIFLCLISCSDYLIKSNQSTGPQIVVHPSIVEFGHLISGQETGQTSFVVINSGDENLVISNPEMLFQNERYSLDESEIENYTILPGEFLDFNVYYEPETYEFNENKITFSTNVEDKEEYTLNVTGFGDAPVMNVTPEIFDYGQISIGCNNEERITIRNNGNLDLTINNLSQMATQPQDIVMNFGSLSPLPWILSPNQEIDFIVSYSPSDVSYDESLIRIESNDPVLPTLDLIQHGEGDVEHWHNQSHTQEEIPVIDIIFVIDNSGSMNSFQSELANQMSMFMSVFSISNTDYHIGFITTDNGYFVEFNGLKWIDNNYASPVFWTEEVIGSIGIAGSGHEMGIENAAYALQNDAAPSTLFWRNNATLAIIYVSDEPDHSPAPLGYYISFFDSLKPSSSQIKQFAVIGDYPSGCVHSGTRSISFGSGYYEMTQTYNGSWYSICSIDWGQQMQNLANSVSVQSSFILNESDPIESTIEVTVNGQHSSEWSYNVATNSVVFNPESIPEPGQTVTISYAVWGC